MKNANSKQPESFASLLKKATKIKSAGKTLTKFLNTIIAAGLTPTELDQIVKAISNSSRIGITAIRRELGALLAEQRKSQGPTRSTGGEYLVEGNATYHERGTMAGPVLVKLANFSAEIVSEEVCEDGAEQTASFRIEGTHESGRSLPAIVIPASRFSAMNWPTESWGVGAVVSAGQSARDHLRAAVQLGSQNGERRVVYSHTGWRKFPDGWAFLHAGGAIAHNAHLFNADVNLAEKLNSYLLPDPPTSAAAIETVRASLELLDVAPRSVTFPLLCATYRASLGEAADTDLSIQIVGPTGSQKTELAALAQGHFGAAFNARNLPGNWHSTSNSLERQSFLAKDVVFVIDDFAPGGAATDVARFHRDADRILRGQANRSGRGRMRADGSLRPDYFSRGLILFTGEDVPRGHSLRARIFIVDVSRGDVDLAKLTLAQQAASDGLLAQAMAAYIFWLATKIDALKKALPARQRGLRDEARQSTFAHDQIPSQVASLYVGFETFLRFAGEIGAIDKHQTADLAAECWAALLTGAKAHAVHQAAAEPTERFLDLLRSALASGHAHVAALSGDAPKISTMWGWRLEDSGTSRETWRPHGERLGWVDGDDLYLEPGAAYNSAQRMAVQGGESLKTPALLSCEKVGISGISGSATMAHSSGNGGVGARNARNAHFSEQGVAHEKEERRGHS